MATYEPALCLRLQAKHAAPKRLHVIMAADGTVLDAMEETADTLPLWVTGLVQLPAVDVTRQVYGLWHAFAAIRASAEAHRVSARHPA